MKSVLRSLLLELHRRAASLQQATEVPAHQDLHFFQEEAKTRVAGAVSRIQELLDDPALGAREIFKENCIVYGALCEDVYAIEQVFLPVLQRYKDDHDHKLFRLSQEIKKETNHSLPVPICVPAYGEFYASRPSEWLIYVPVLEIESILGLPDYYHELANLVLAHTPFQEVESAKTAIGRQLVSAIQEMELENRPRSHVQVLQEAASRWFFDWAAEFACDAIASYLVGPAYAWSHLQVTMGLSKNIWGIAATHPSDEARARIVLSVLRQQGWANEAANFESKWSEYVTLARESRPLLYDRVYGDDLLDILASAVIQDASRSGLRSFTPSSTEQRRVASRLNEGWKLFLDNPDQYEEWTRHAWTDLFS